MNARPFLVLLVVLFACGEGTALADEPRRLARQHFQEAEQAAAAGQHDRAARDYESSFADVPTPEAIYDAAREWEAAGEPARAADDYETAVARTDLRGPQLRDAKARLAVLEPSLGLLVVESPSEGKIFVGHVQGASPPVRAHLAAGDYSVTLQGPFGQTTKRDVHIVTAQTVTVALDLPPPPVAPHPDVVPTAAHSTSRYRLRTPGYVMIGVAGLFAAGTAVAYAEGVSARNQFEGMNDLSVSLRNQAATWRTVAYVGDVATGVSAAAAALLLALGLTTRTEPREGQSGLLLEF
jgi:hypothetical protein